MCHTPQTTEPNTGNTVDFKVMIHKIHMGSQLPSVKAGKPYQIGGGANPSDWSTVVFPSDPRRCESCHDPKSGAAQADAWLKNPSRAACGSCHDNVNFATGENHVNLPQVTDNQCANCHIPQGELEFDASIQGAHMIPQRVRDRARHRGRYRQSGKRRRRPEAHRHVHAARFPGQRHPDQLPWPTSPNRISLILAGPTTDYGYTNFGSDVTTPGYVSETPRHHRQVRATTAPAPTPSPTPFRRTRKAPSPSASKRAAASCCCRAP